MKALLLSLILLPTVLLADQTLSIIKPNAVQDHHIGAIIQKLELNGLNIRQMKMMTLTHEQAENFYAEHKGRPFFQSLVRFMTSGPVVVMILEGDDSVTRYRDLMGSTNPQEARPGTIRAEFAASIEENAVHGSDSPESAKREIKFFFG